MAERHALLIGVPRYDDPELDDTRLGAAVTADIAAMRDALAHSGFDITVRGMDGPHDEATPNRIRRAVKAACANAPLGGVLLIYFSGHGVTVGGQDYLVPSDAYLADARIDAGTLVPVIDASSLAACRARLVVFFVDACRDNPAGDQSPGEPGGQLPFLADGGHFVIVMGCGAGQVCQYDESGSAFTQALAQVLDHRHPARTLRDVVEAVTTDMRRRSRQYQGAEQVPVVRYPKVLELAGSIPVCDGDELTAAWRKAVGQPLSRLCADPDLAERVRAVVTECARRCGAAHRTLRDRTGLADAWTDQNYPGRVLQNIRVLLGDAPDLRPGEAAMLIAAPFLREAVFAEGIRDAAAIDPANLDRTYKPGPRGDLELTHEMHQHLVQRAAGLRQANHPQASDQLAMWLVHQWLATRVKLWEEPGALDAYAPGRELIEGCRGTASEDEVPKLIQALLLAVGADPVDERLLGRLNSPYVDERWRGVAAVLWLAGIMAADLRRLPPVIPDLVGTRMELPLADVQDAAGRRATWGRQEDGGELDLRLACEHPALHDAFENIVHRVGKARETIGARLRLPDAIAKLLPGRFTATGLRPVIKSDDEPAYEVPLSRFQIAEEKVRELLMGKQLYGDPALAIRELYQNALDACRWRQTRHEYLQRTGKDPAPWAGLIRFEQGTDKDGRPFIECEDNGVGMDINTLKHVFANAGERFVYGQDFRAEQADWENEDPPLRMVPNSQFGVGVFSYFMLADEITVLTRHQRREGVVAGQAHEVRIASSGSLLQINPADGLQGGGTRVRLYLSGDPGDISVLRTLRRLLWTAEYRVEATGQDGHETWAPGGLRYQPGSVEPLQHGRDLWWVSGQGGMTADGIETDVRGFGLVVNLRDERRPQFTVDRRTVRAWDKDWRAGQISESLPGLMDWPGFTLSWLWQVAQSDAAIAQQIFEYAAAIGQRVRIGETWGQAAPVSLSTVGCLPIDRTFFTQESRGSGRWFDAWQAGVWRAHVLVPANLPEASTPESIAGFPVPDPVDAELLGRLQIYYHDARPTSEEILSALTHPRHSVRSQLRRLRKYAITGLDFSSARQIPPIDTVVEDEMLLPALAAWSPPGEPRRRHVAAQLVQASYELDQPLGEVLRRAQSLAPGSWSVPALDLANLAGHTSTETEKFVLSHDRDGEPPWIEGDLIPAHLAALSEQLGQPMEQILGLCDLLAPLGVTVAAREAYPRELEAIEVLALQHVGAPGQTLNPLVLLMIAGQLGMPIGAAHRSLARLEEHGLLVRPDLKGPVEFTPTSRELDVIRTQIQNYSQRSDRVVVLNESPCLEIAALLAQKHGQDPALQSSARLLIPFTSPDTPLTAAELAQAAYLFNTTLAEAATALRAIYPEIQLPSFDADCADLTVPWHLYTALLEREKEVSWLLGPGDIVGGALASWQPLGDFLCLLDPFRRLGAPVPPCDEAIRATLNQVELDDYDKDMLTVFGEFGDTAYLRAVTALNLVRIAGRLGWTPAQAHRRLARLVPLGLALDYPDAELPDEIVRWQDLLLLTVYFDGQPPALSGTVDQAYLDKAAGEIGESADWLRARLVLYAPLFQLDITEEDADD